jgi:phosphatidate cytidylyltransferase
VSDRGPAAAHSREASERRPAPAPVAAPSTTDPRLGSRSRSILRRTATGAALVLVLALALWVTDRAGSSWPVLAIGSALSVAMVVELSRMGTLAGRGLGLAGGAGLVAVLLVLVSLRDAVDDLGAPIWVVAYAAAAAAGGLVSLRHAPLRGAAAAAWVAAPLPLLSEIWTAFGHGGLVAVLALSKIGDIAGYYVGNAMGRHHPFKRLSPGKTTEGCVASLVAGVAAGMACAATGLLPGGANLALAALVGALVNIAAQAGDLLESWVKRRAGVKDSGTWLGPSGGLLDVTDSLLVSVPVALATWPVLLT